MNIIIQKIQNQFRKLFVNIYHQRQNHSNLLPKQQLGRWTVEYCNRMNRKIDFANHDNCGTCIYLHNP